jgi:hypothetical protein
MWDFNWLQVVFFSQVLIISFYLPKQALALLKRVMDSHPPSQYPKLYPVPIVTIEKAMRVFAVMNFMVLLAGLALILHGIYSASQELLNWDSQSVLTIYFFLQMTPLLFLGLTNIKYFKLMYKANTSAKRKADLSPRRLLSYISGASLGVAVVVYLAFVLLVIYIKQAPFDGFAGYWNIFGITMINLFFAMAVAMLLYGKKMDPHQSSEDRFNQTARIIKILCFSSIAGTVFMSVNFLLSSLDLRHLNDVAQSIYFQLVFIVAFQYKQLMDGNFDVYKSDAVST